MFFRRVQTAPPSFTDHLDRLRAAGFRVEPAGPERAQVGRDALVALIEDAGGGRIRIADCGILLRGAIARLTDRGFQKVFRTDDGRTLPALAEHLKALHAFLEDLREHLHLVSLYNESLGSTNQRHLYDRVLDRDRGVARRPWEPESR